MQPCRISATAKPHSGQRGAELVEFAISSSLLFLLLFGIIEFSVALFDKQTITNAAREGARTGILFRPQPRQLAEEDQIIEAAVHNYAGAYLISLGGDATMEVEIERPGGEPFDVGDELIVTVNYPYRFLLLPNLTGDLNGILSLSSTAVMRAE